MNIEDFTGNIPPITKYILVISVALSIAVNTESIHLDSIMFHPKAIVQHFEVRFELDLAACQQQFLFRGL